MQTKYQQAYVLVAVLNFLDKQNSNKTLENAPELFHRSQVERVQREHVFITMQLDTNISVVVSTRNNEYCLSYLQAIMSIVQNEKKYNKQTNKPANKQTNKQINY